MPKKTSRRAVLTGMGLGAIAAALPPLESLLIRRKGQVVQAQTIQTPKRFVLFHWGDGGYMNSFTTDARSALTPQGIAGSHPIGTDVNPFVSVVRGLSNDDISLQIPGSVSRHLATITTFTTE
ncbi:MAG: hypothetical protein IPJ88_17620 [Myxococcales bacterium]|nr:MAG: hypothetical protein IPJ88_17620 [Myxococcales bacterium]